MDKRKQIIKKHVEDNFSLNRMYDDLFSEVVPVEEPVVEEAAEDVIEDVAPVLEEVPMTKETDALSLEELERDLFGDDLTEEEATVTRIPSKDKGDAGFIFGDEEEDGK